MQRWKRTENLNNESKNYLECGITRTFPDETVGTEWISSEETEGTLWINAKETVRNSDGAVRKVIQNHGYEKWKLGYFLSPTICIIPDSTNQWVSLLPSGRSNIYWPV